MERFAIKIDKKIKASLYKICRLCGMDKPDMVKILPEDGMDEKDPINIDVDTQLSQKIYELIGLMVSKDDKMPQNMCSLCIEKIVDFYEFREMCLATNIQTRKLLGLKVVEAVNNKTEDIKPNIWINNKASFLERQSRGNYRKRKSEDVTIKKETLVAFSRALTNKRLRLSSNLLRESAIKKVKKQNFSNLAYRVMDIKKKEKSGIKKECSFGANTIRDTSNISASSKLKQFCYICCEGFASKAKLEAHLRTSHIPKVQRFVCTACDEVLSKSFDVKNHQLWHKLSKTPYKCGLCSEKLFSFYTFTRHIRDHNFEVPSALLVLDRECPKCQLSFVTNFLYNIHPCSMQTKYCAGCNRLQRTDNEYLKHSAHCSKAYLTYSKHILATITSMEESVRIKNENDVETAAEELCKLSGLSFNMNPVVCLTRLKSPLLMGVRHLIKTPLPKYSTKKCGKNRISKKDYRRVDELLKSTLDTLVSIKHEPEVNVGTEEPFTALEVTYRGRKEIGNNDSEKNSEIHLLQNIKKEVLDLTTDNVDYDNNECSNKIPIIKLKIKKEHGQLNSSLIEQNVESRIEKRKKKKKHKVKHKMDVNIMQAEQDNATGENTDIFMTLPTNEDINVRIKMESQAMWQNNTHTDNMEPSATIMTSIPIMQLKITSVSEGVEFNNSIQPEETIINKDIKPNRKELDNLLNIIHDSRGVEMPSRESPTILSANESLLTSIVCADKTVTLQSIMQKNQKLHSKNLHQTTVKTNKGVDSIIPPLQISSIQEGISMSSSEIVSVAIKPEPMNRGYADEVYRDKYVNETASLSANPVETAESEITGQIALLDEEQYISVNDFHNVRIKEEQDLDIHDVQWTQICQESIVDRDRNNKDKLITDESKNTESEGEEEQEDVSEMEEVEKERVYRELELPPELQHLTRKDKRNLNDDAQLICTANYSIVRKKCQHVPFVISKVCSQIELETIKCNIPTKKKLVSDVAHSENYADIGLCPLSSTTSGNNYAPSKEENECQESMELLQTYMTPSISFHCTPKDLLIETAPNKPLCGTDCAEKTREKSPKGCSIVIKSKSILDNHQDSQLLLTSCEIINKRIYQEKEQELQAKSFCDAQYDIDDSITENDENTTHNVNAEEDQQNQQNQDLLVQQRHTWLAPVELLSHPYLEDISSSGNSLLSENQQSAVSSLEQTENALNVFNDLQRTDNLRNVPLQFYFESIDEIAENNNNANIERELQDGEHVLQQPLEPQTDDIR